MIVLGVTHTFEFPVMLKTGVSSQPVSVLAQAASFVIRCESADFTLESIDVDYQILGSNP